MTKSNEYFEREEAFAGLTFLPNKDNKELKNNREILQKHMLFGSVWENTREFEKLLEKNPSWCKKTGSFEEALKIDWFLFSYLLKRTSEQVFYLNEKKEYFWLTKHTPGFIYAHQTLRLLVKNMGKDYHNLPVFVLKNFDHTKENAKDNPLDNIEKVTVREAICLFFYKGGKDIKMLTDSTHVFNIQHQEMLKKYNIIGLYHNYWEAREVMDSRVEKYRTELEESRCALLRQSI